MSNTHKIMQSFLTKLNSEEVKELFETLDLLVENLENKDDPEMFEVHLFNAAIDAIEKFKLMQGILKEQKEGKLTGDKLQSLYDNHQGSSVLFN